MPGGYPIKTTGDGGIELDLPKGCSPSEAIRINEKAQRFDGIAHVEAGLVRSTDEACSTYKEITGHDLPTVTTGNVVSVAEQSVSALNERYGFGLRLSL